MNKRTVRGIFWILLYILLTITPLLVMLIPPKPPGRELWRDFSVALGFTGMAMMALQFVISARIKIIKAPYGSDIVYFFHKQISIMTSLLILAHPVLLFIYSPDTLQLLNVFTAPNRARAADLAAVALITLIVTSVFRKQLGIKYIPWRIAHGILATIAVVFGIVHMELVGYYLSSPWKQVLWILYGVVWVAIMVYVRIIQPIILLRNPYEVVSVTREKGDATTLKLQPKGHAGFKFKPGQFAWLTAWKSPFADNEHPFSFSSSAQNEIFDFTIKELGAFTKSIKNLKPGEIVYVDGPYGAFSMDRHPQAEGFLFIAGGIGITPMMSMLRTMKDRDDTRPVHLIYASKDIDALTFLDELQGLEKYINLKITYVLEQPPENWNGEIGFISREILQEALPAKLAWDSFEIFICGPEPMMNAVESHLVKLKVPYGVFHSERFNFV